MRERVQGALLGVGAMIALLAVRTLIPSLWGGVLANAFVMALFGWLMFYLDKKKKPPPAA
jgi:ABC-type uncharacterized transport system permease subunit